MNSANKSNEIERIADMLRLEMNNRPSEDFIKSFIRQIDSLAPNVLRYFRSTLSQTLIERENQGKGHLKIEALLELLDLCDLQVWLTSAGLHEKAARNVVKGLKNRSTEELNRIIHGKLYIEHDRTELLEFLVDAGVEGDDAEHFVKLVREMDVSVTEIIDRIFKLNFLAENAFRQESLRGMMSLKEIVTLYLYSVLQVTISDYVHDEETISEIAARLALCNNMRREFALVQQLERYFFSTTSVEDTQNKTRDFWIKLLNDYEVKLALEQYIGDDKLKRSDMEIADLYVEAGHIFDDVSEIKDQTLAVISITYRLDNPEETGHTVEELLAIIDQIKLLTTEMGPLSIMTRDIFSFFEILGESDHKNHFFHKTIISFRSLLRKLVDLNEKTGERVTLDQLILTYLHARLKAFLEDYEGPREKHLESIKTRISHCHDMHRQFAITDLVEEHIFENPGLLLTLSEPDKYWPELINTFELNIMLEIYIEREYLVSGHHDMTKRQMMETLQQLINGIQEISIKSLSVVFLTAHLAAMQDHAKSKTVSLDEIIQTIAQLRKDAEMAAKQITVESRVKHDILTTLTERLFRLETIQSAITLSNTTDIIDRLDEVIVGLRTRRDNLIGGKMDAKVLQDDLNTYLHDSKVVGLIDEVERLYKNELAQQAKLVASK